MNRAWLTTTAKFYDKDKKDGLTKIGPTLSPMKIGPTGLPAVEAGSKTRKKGQPKAEPIVEEIPLWSKKSLTQHTRKEKETLTLLQQGKYEEVEVFVGNNTKQRNRKGMVAGMLQEHLQKIVNVML